MSAARGAPYADEDIERGVGRRPGRGARPRRGRGRAEPQGLAQGKGTSMNATKGMAVEEVRRMAQMLADASEEITRIKDELTAGLAEVDWTGPDADRFRSQWEGEMVPALQEISQSVGELGTTAESNAAQQDAASS